MSSKSIVKKSARILLYIISTVVLLVCLLLLFINLPIGKRIVRNQVQSYLAKKLKTNVRIGSIDYSLPTWIEINNLYVEDQQKDSLLYGEKIAVEVSMLKLLRGNTDIQQVSLKNIAININRAEKDSFFNYQFMIDAFTGNKPDTQVNKDTAELKLTLSKLLLDKVSLKFDDRNAGTIFYAVIDKLDAGIDQFRPDKLRFVLKDFYASGLDFKMHTYKGAATTATETSASRDTSTKSNGLYITAAIFDIRDAIVKVDNSISGMYYANQVTHLNLEKVLFDLNRSTATGASLLLDSSFIQFTNPRSKPSLKNNSSTSSTAWYIQAGKVSLKNNQVKYDDNNNAPAAGFDRAHFNAKNIRATIQSLVYAADSTVASISQFAFDDTSGFSLDSVHADFMMNNSQLYANNLYIKTPHSLIRNAISLKYDSLSGITKTPQNSLLAATLQKCVIAFNDLYLLNPDLKKSFPPDMFANNFVQFNTEVRGTLQRLYLPHLELTALSGSTIDASGTLYNLTDATKFYYDLYFNSSSFRKADILKFVPLQSRESMGKLPDIIHLKGRIKGNKDNLESDISVDGKDLAINGKFSLKNISNPAKLSYDFAIRNSSFNKNFIEGFIPPGTLPPQVNLPQKLTAKGSFDGDSNNFTADLQLGGSYGPMTVKGWMKNIKDTANATYDLVVTTNGFKIGQLLGQDSVLGAVTGSVAAKGKGFNYKTMRSAIDANIHQLEFNNYNYKNAHITAKLNNGIINSKGAIDDTSLRMHYDLALNVKEEYPSVNGIIRIDTAQLKQLHLYDSTLNFSLFADIKANDLRPGHLDIDTKLDSIRLQLNKSFYTLDTIKLLASSANLVDDVQFNSDLASLHANGKFNYTSLGNDLLQYIDHYYNIVDSNSNTTAVDQQVKFEGEIKKHPIITGIIHALKAYEPISFEGSFSSADTDSALNVKVTAPYLQYNTDEVRNARIGINSKNEKLNYNISFDTLRYASNIFYATKLDGNAVHDSIMFNFLTKDNKQKDWFGLKASLFSREGTYSFRLKDSLLLNYEPWQVASDNYIRYAPAGLIIHNFDIKSDTASILINSRQEINNSPVDISINNFNLKSISSIISNDTLFASGILNAKMELSDLNKNVPAFTGNLSINNLELMQQPLGNVTAFAEKQSENNITATLNLLGNGNDVAAKGNYYLNSADKEFDANVAIKKLNLASIQSFTAGSIKSATGNIYGNMDVSGKLSDPRWKGALNFDTTRFTVTQFGAPFKINKQQIIFDFPAISFQQFTILDSLDHPMQINGAISYNKDKVFDLNMNLNAKDFIVLNATRAQGKELFGFAAINANIGITGTSAKPVIDGNILLNDNSNITIVVPERNYSKDEGKTIVRFIDRDTFDINPPVLAFRQEKENTESFAQFLNYNLNIEMRKEASLTIIIDPATGDEIKVQGDARLNAGVDPGGNIILSGTYELADGYYVFNYQFLQRKFNLVKGSTIVFGGAPMDAQVNVTAEYEVVTSAKDLLGNEVGSIDPSLSNSFNQKTTFKVVLYLSGILSKPQIKFDIQLPEENTIINSDLRTTIENKLAQIRGDESATNKQVFSLLLLGRFVGEQSSDFFKGNGNDFNDLARQSVSRFISSALNEIAGNLVKGVDIDLNLNSYRDYTAGGSAQRTDLNVVLSKSFLNDRLTVSVGKNFGIEGQDAAARSTQKNGFLPDVTLSYKLTKDGKYLLRAYRKNQYEVIVDGYVVETGLGFIVTMDYNKFYELFGKKSNRRQRKKN